MDNSPQNITLLSFKTKLNPNNKQRTQFEKISGCARYTYNWALEYQNNNYTGGTGTFISKFDLNKIFIATEKQQNPWLYDVSKCATQQPIHDLDNAFKRFFDKKVGYPQFKKKGKNDGFYIDSNIKIIGNSIQIAKVGLVRLHEDVSEFKDIKIKSIRIKKENYDWYVSFFYEVPVDHALYPKNKQHPVVGCDLGIKSFAVLSNGMTFDTPKKFKNHQKSLKNLQRKLARQKLVDEVITNKKGHKQTVKVSGKNREKTKEKLSRLHRKIADERKNITNQFTTYVTKNHSAVGVEDLNVSGMLRNHNLAAGISNSNFGEIRRQLEYKGKLYGCEIVVIDRFFPSTKKCSCCGNVKEKISLSERVYNCECCGLSIDRDENAAINIKMETLRILSLKKPTLQVKGSETKRLNDNETASSAGIAFGGVKVTTESTDEVVNPCELGNKQ